MSNGTLRTILVPLDGSAFARHALPVARSIAVRTGASLILSHVHIRNADRVTGELPLGGFRITDAAADDEQRRYEMDELTACCRELVAGDLAVSCDLLDGPVVPALIEQVAFSAVDLVVMTTHGRGAFARAWLGSVVDAFVRHNPVPTLLVRPQHGTENEQPDAEQLWLVRRMLIPLDGSALAEQILEPAIMLARTLGAEVLLLRVAAPVPMVAETIAREQEALQPGVAAVQLYLDNIARNVRERGLVAAARVEVAHEAARTILDVAREHCDLIALATQGRGGLARVLMGSVADKIIRGANTPVLLLRPGQHADHASGA